MNKRISIILTGGLIFTIYSLIYLSSANDPSLHDVKLLGLFSVIQLIYSVISWKRMGHDYFDAYVVFIVAFYMFNVGQTITEALGFDLDYRRLWDDFGLSARQYYNAAYYSLASLAAFHIGAITSPIETRTEAITEFSDYSALTSLKKAAIVGAIISVPFYLYNLTQQIAVVQAMGYKGLYEVAYASRSTSIIADLFPPSMIVLFYVSIASRWKEKLIPFITIILLFIPPLYLGGRSNAMILASLFLIVYSAIRGISRKQLLLIIGGGFILLILMNVISITRVDSTRSIEGMIQALGKDNPILATIQEMGWSMYPLSLSMEVVPSTHDFTYGSSFFWALVNIIPNIGFWSGVHPAQAHDMANYINECSGLGYGIGYSLIAQCWNDFGYLGPVALLIIGRLFALAFSGVSSKSAMLKPAKFAMSILFLWFAIKCVRNGMYGLARGAAYYMLPIYWMYKLFLKKSA